jgi:hypothetical protein
MKINYSIWQGSSLLGVFTATNADEIHERMDSLKSLGEFTYNVFKIEAK